MFLDTELNKFFPGVYILLNNKTEFIYTHSLNYIKNKINDINPHNLHLKTITCDFERGLINAINNVFPHIVKIGCYFHYKQALIRNANKLGLGKKNMEKETKELINKELGIFPFLNFNNIEEIKNKVENLK